MSGYRYRGAEQPAAPQTSSSGRTAAVDAGLTVGKVRVDVVRVHGHNVRHDLGDLRPLAASIRRHGVMQPIVVERRGDHLRLRAGHRRLAAAKLAGLERIPALIHADCLDDEQWLIASIQENVQRQQLSKDERVRAVRALLELGCTRAGIAEEFGVSTVTLGRWIDGSRSTGLTRRQISDRARSAAREDLTKRHRAEFEQLVAEHRARIEQEVS